MSVTIKQQIDQDLKKAMLAGDKNLVMTLRGIKSAILYVEVAKNARDEGLTEAEVQDVLSKEVKKRQESADMYIQGGSPDKAQAELDEKRTIESYLPAQISDAELKNLVQDVIKDLNASGMQQMGQVIAEVKKRSDGGADGGRIAAIVKDELK